MYVREFTVVYSKGMVWFSLFAGLFCIFLPVMFTMTGQETHPVMYVSFGGFVLLSFLLALHMSIYKIRVEGSTIHVRKGLLRKFSIGVSEIDQIKVNRVKTSVFRHIRIPDRTITNTSLFIWAGSRKFVVNSFMKTIEYPQSATVVMLAYLVDRVHENKIHVRSRDTTQSKRDHYGTSERKYDQPVPPDDNAN